MTRSGADTRDAWCELRLWPRTPSAGRRTLRHMRLPVLEVDGWELESGEDRHVAAPETFAIPARPARERLRPGQAAKLLFRIGCDQSDDFADVDVERMWVVVTGRIGGLYLGVLSNQPATIVATDDAYLVRGAEVPFGPEHVIDIDDPPAEYVEEITRTSPARLWSVG